MAPRGAVARRALRWDDPDSFSQTCFVPGHGVSAPPFLQDSGHIHRRTYGATPTTATPATTATGATGAPRPILFYFAGTLMLEHPMYSQGVRQEVFRLFQNESGFSVRFAFFPSSVPALGRRCAHACACSVDTAKPACVLLICKLAGNMHCSHTPLNTNQPLPTPHPPATHPTPRLQVNSYGEHPLDEMRRATFCLCPLGSGWGMRLVQAVAYGCLPVIIQDEARGDWIGLCDWIVFDWIGLD